jgi:hypothetical protein
VRKKVISAGADVEVREFPDGGKQGGPFKNAAWELPQSPVGIPSKGL